MQTKEPHELRGGGQGEKEPQTTQEQKQLETTLTTKVEQSKMQTLEVEPHIELVEEEVKIIDLDVGIEPLVDVQVETTKIVHFFAWMQILSCSSPLHCIL